MLRLESCNEADLLSHIHYTHYRNGDYFEQIWSFE